MSHSVAQCINCAVKNLDCDEAIPRCSSCARSSISCSYDWNLANPVIYGLFRGSVNYNDQIRPFYSGQNSVGGRFGTVYRGDLKGEGLVAVKIIFRDQPAAGPTAFLISLREAWNWHAVQHTHIIPFLGIASFGTICRDGSPQVCLITRWMEEGNIMQYGARHADADRLQLLLHAIDGLAFLHSRSPPIIHGGLKGGNILISVQDGVPKALLRDFGHQRALQHYGTEYETTSVLPPQLAARWVAFERLMPAKFGISDWDASQSPASDVFELMRTFLEVLSGRRPYFNFPYDGRVTMEAYRLRNPERPPDCLPELNEKMWDFMEHAWSLDIQKRPSLAETRQFVEKLRA